MFNGRVAAELPESGIGLAGKRPLCDLNTVWTETMSETGLDEETLARLRHRAATGPLPQVLVLPSEIRNGRRYYGEIDVDAVKVARALGVEAEFLYEGAARRFLSEYSAEVIVGFAIAVAQQLSADGVIAVGKYLLGRLASLAERGVIHAADETRVRVEVERINVRTRETNISVNGMRIEAVGRHAVIEVIRALANARAAQAAMRELGLAENDEAQ